ncbi:hypothetical protein [Cryobacterium sp. Y57]|uniref:hypothetical protein n=1 Tax=Cryobacterium sp. Y57 TaxID=2048287 RepID=UPI000CE3BDFC|nr:hypothetical protein [Cryobacterium sp. Y57]
MTLDRAVRRSGAPVSVPPLISLLALAALLFAILAIHSETTGHAMHTLVPASSAGAASSAVAEHQTSVTGMAAVMAAPVVAMMSSGSRGGMLECTLLAMTCVLLLTLVVMVFLTRLPARYRRPLDTCVTSISCRISAQPRQRPSLTLLSICRV